MKIRQQVAVRPHNGAQTVERGGEQRRRHVLQDVPHQYPVELFVFEVESLAQKLIDTPLVGLIARVRVPENIVQGPDKIFGVQAVSQVGDEVDILLAGSGQIEYGQPRLIAEKGKELFQTPAWA